MSTEFTEVSNGQTIDASHVNQFADPINDLESGAAFYRAATGSGAPYEVDFAGSLDSLSAGQIIVFKANVDSPASASLLVDYGSSNDSGAIPLNAGDEQVGAGRIKADQIVVAVYNNTTTPRFDIASSGAGELAELLDVDMGTLADNDVLQYDTTSGTWVNKSLASAGVAGLDGSGKVPPSQLPTSSLDDLDDVTVGTPADKEVLQYDNGSSQFVNRSPSDAGLVETSRTISTTAPLSGGGALSSDLTLSMPAATSVQNGHLTSTDWSTFDGKQDALTGTSDVPGLDAALAAKQALSEKNQASGYAGLDGSSKLAVSQIPSGVDAANIGSGSVSNTEFGYLDGVTSSIQSQLDSHTHAASDITSGSLGLARGGTGSDLSATGGTGQVLKQSTSGGAITVGAISAGDMPSGVDAANIGSGSVSNTEFGYLDGVTSSIQSQLDNHTHAASDITSGSLGLARGGTGSDLSATGGAGQVLKQSTSGGAVTVGALDASDISSGTLPLSRGGTGATTASGARSNLGAQGQDQALDDITGLTLSKGDLLVSDGTNIQRLASGSNGQVLQSDSAQSLGVKWASGVTGTGSGAANYLAHWNGTSSQSYNASYYLDSSYLYSPRLWLSSGILNSGTDLYLQRNSTARMRFSYEYTYPQWYHKTYLYNLPIYTSSGAVVYRYTSTGEIHHVSSSRQFKRNIRNMERVKDKLMGLRPVRFEGLAPADEPGSQEANYKEGFGLIAEEVEELFPDLCYRVPGNEANQDVCGIHYDRIVVYLLAAWQEQVARHEERLAELETQLGGSQ